MVYNIYVNGKLSAVAKDSMSAVMRCNAYAEHHKADKILSFNVGLDGIETAHDWKEDYRQLCNG